MIKVQTKRLKFSLNILIGKYLKYMENIESASAHTLRAYSLDLDQAYKKENSKSLSDTELLKLTQSALLRWGPLSLSSRNRKAATLKSFLNYLFREQFIARDLSLHIHCPKVPRKLPHFISVDEATAVLRSIQKNAELEHQLLFLLLYGSGLRVSEACELQWSNIRLNQRVATLKGKGGKERVIVLQPKAVQILKALQKFADPSDSVWGSDGLSTRTAFEWVRYMGRDAGLLKPLNPHALRHSFATHLLASGANLRTLQELLGHETLSATERYTHLGIDALARTLESFHPLGESAASLKPIKARKSVRR